jgi:hypothetical protein
MVPELGSNQTAKGTSTSNKLEFNAATGTLTTTNFDSLSDFTLKENFSNIENALGIIEKLDALSFNWKNNGNKAFGFIAQDVQKILPNIVSETKEYKAISYIQIIPILVQAIKELKAQIKK